MWPSIKSDSVLEIQTAPVAIGSIVAVLRNTVVIAHRVVSIKQTQDGTFLKLWGDHNKSPDGWFSDSTVIGKVVRSSRYDEVNNYEQRGCLVKMIVRIFVWNRRRPPSVFSDIVSYFCLRLLHFLTKDYGWKVTMFRSIYASRQLTQREREYLLIVSGRKSMGKNQKSYLLWCAQNKIPPAIVEKNIRDKDRNRDTKNFFVSQELKTLKLRNTAREIEQIFRDKQIDVLPLKGPGIHLSEFDWRSDIDILVKPSQFELAKSTLIDHGYVVKNSPPQGVTLISAENIEIDVHQLVAVPRIHQISQSQVRKLTRLIWTNREKGRSVNELLFLAAIVNFWNNDFGKGIGVYLTLLNWLNTKVVQQAILIRYARILSIEWLVWLMLGRARVITDGSLLQDSYPIPQSNKRLQFLLTTTSIGQLLQKGGKHTWWYDASMRAWPLTLEAKFTQLIADNQVPVTRLVRPRIMLYVLIILIQRIISASNRHDVVIKTN